MNDDLKRVEDKVDVILKKLSHCKVDKTSMVYKIPKVGAFCLVVAGVLFFASSTEMFGYLFATSAILAGIYHYFHGVEEHPIITGLLMGINIALITAIALFL